MFGIGPMELLIFGVMAAGLCAVVFIVLNSGRKRDE